jgi:hypothetical protein
MMQAHAERAHALLSASKASQWLNCPPSARLQEGIPDKSSEDADRGTTAHELAEVRLRQRLTVPNTAQRDELERQIKSIKATKFYDQEMEEFIQDYVDYVEEQFLVAKTVSPDAVVLLEAESDFSQWVPEGKGIADVVIISDGSMRIIDLKYGAGVPVSAIDNPQIRLYGLGAWANYNYLFDIHEVYLTIVQPRLDSITVETMSIDQLLDWAEKVVKPTAILAWSGEGEYHPGEKQCRWCQVKAICRARADEAMKALAYEFHDPALLTDEEIGSVLAIADELHAWAKQVKEYALEQAKSGHRIPQWKLVAGKSDRTITDKDTAKAALEAAGIEQDKYLKPQELLGITALEKQIGKKELTALIGDLIAKPQGKPVLVSESDNRPELNSIENDFENIDMEA